MTAQNPILEHVARPNLPWRDEMVTECGLSESPTRVILTMDQFEAKVGSQGQQRAAMSTCMTCWSTGERNRDTWATNPASVILRYVRKAWWEDRSPELIRLNLEFQAIAALIATHREQFDGYLADAEHVQDLADIRMRRLRRSRS